MERCHPLLLLAFAGGALCLESSGCGTSYPAISSGEVPGDVGDASDAADASRTASGVPGFVDAAAGPPCVAVGDAAEATRGPCGCSELSLLGDPPNLYFVLDRSGSMAEGGKFQAVREVAGELVTALGSRASFGAALFPDPASRDACASGRQVYPVTRGGTPGVPGPVTFGFLQSTNYAPTGGTPTASVLRALLPILTSLQGRTFAILATDGGPNCDAEVHCSTDQCIPNIESAAPSCTPAGPTNCCSEGTFGPGQCLDGDATTRAVENLAAAGILTFVVGIPGSAPYASLLDRLAIAGGTALAGEPRYYAVASTGVRDLERSLRKVAARVTASCTVTLASAPAEPDRVNVYLDDVVVPRDPLNGWTLHGNQLSLTGLSCDKLGSGEALSLRIIAGCATVSK